MAACLNLLVCVFQELPAAQAAIGQAVAAALLAQIPLLAKAGIVEHAAYRDIPPNAACGPWLSGTLNAVELMVGSSPGDERSASERTEADCLAGKSVEAEGVGAAAPQGGRAPLRARVRGAARYCTAASWGLAAGVAGRAAGCRRRVAPPVGRRAAR